MKHRSTEHFTVKKWFLSYSKTICFVTISNNLKYVHNVVFLFPYFLFSLQNFKSGLEIALELDTAGSSNFSKTKLFCSNEILDSGSIQDTFLFHVIFIAVFTYFHCIFKTVFTYFHCIFITVFTYFCVCRQISV